MTRKEHEKATRNKILKETHNLFLEQGYSKTTIRQIIQKCGIKTGTLYHFFKNKEDIFRQLSSNVFDWVSVRGDKDVNDQNVCLRFAKENHFHLAVIMTDPKSRELYLMAYQSPDISKALNERRTIRYSKLFSEFNPDYEYEDFLANSFFIKGVLHSIAVEWISEDHGYSHKVVQIALRRMLELYNIPYDQIEETINSLDSVDEIKKRLDSSLGLD